MAGARMARVWQAYGLRLPPVPTGRAGLAFGISGLWSGMLTGFGARSDAVGQAASACWARTGAAVGLALFGGMGLPIAAAASTFTPPEGCTGIFTVQSRSCKLSNHFTCANDAPGDQWRVDFGPFGPYFASRIDHETQWVHSVDLSSGEVSRLLPGAPDPASFSELLDTGTDTFDFSMLRGAGRMTRVRGFDTLTGQSLTINGVTLKETTFTFRETLQDGTFLHGAEGREYIWPEQRIFLSGQSEWTDAEGTSPRDYSPVEIFFPGQDGFMSTRPEHDCDVMMSDLGALPRKVRAEIPPRLRGGE
jgi:hypothetical protein